MKKIKIITVGNLKEKYWQQAQAEYIKRLSKFCKLELSEVNESKIKDENIIIQILNEESANITKKLANDDYIICLAIEGELINSLELAQKINNLQINHTGNIVFIIGGSNGIAQSLKNRANQLISFGKITMPHQMAKIVLLEQIYRAYKINNNQKYHK